MVDADADTKFRECFFTAAGSLARVDRRDLVSPVEVQTTPLAV